MLIRKLRHYQQDALRYCFRVGNPALFMDMGAGKSLVIIRYADLIFAKKILIVTPYSAFYGWQNELILEYDNKAQELIGKPEERIKRLSIDSRYFIINKEGFLSLPEICQVNWDLLIIDESVILKNPKSKISKFFVKNFHHVKHKAILTGLPAPEHDLNYFQQLQFLNQSILGFKNFYHFRYNCFDIDYHDYIMKESYKSVFAKALSENCFFLSREDAGLAGTEIEQIRTVKFTNRKQINIYNRLAEDFILEYKNIKRKTKFVPVAYTLLRQLCSGFINSKFEFDNKIKLLIELINGELKNRKIIIWCQYVCEIKEIHKQLHGIISNQIIYSKIPNFTREESVLHFNKGNLNCLIIHPRCFKYGGDLSGANTAIYFSVPLGLDDLEQSKRRLTRGKKKDYTLYIYLAMKDSLEIDIVEGLQNKKPNSQIMSNIAKKLTERNLNG